MIPRISAVLLLLCGANLAAWTWALAAFGSRPALMGSALLAWGYGLRHAVDADHIAAIDNVTRRMMRDGRRPVAVGLFFSLGHSAVVALACLLIVLARGWFDAHAGGAARWGALAGTLVSAGFLLLIGGSNLSLLVGLLRGRGDAAGAVPRGALAAMLAPLLDRVGGARGLFGLGLLFGLGFDTATEIGVLSIAALGASMGATTGAGIGWSVMCFPALFAAGMSLVDTLDGILMLGAYGWALFDPRGKHAYNVAITGGSVLVAFAVGLVELAGVLPGPDGVASGWIGTLNDHATLVGACVIAGFALSWLAAIGARRLRGRPT